MTTFTEGGVEFVFAKAVEVAQYDQWSGYRKHVQRFAQSKAVDFLVVNEQASELTLIEVKDYRMAAKDDPPPSHLPEIVAQKCRDTLAGLVIAAKSEREREREFARLALRQARILAIVHIDQRRLQFRTNPNNVNLADLAIALRRAFKHAQIKVSVRTTGDTSPGAPYRARFVDES